MSSDKIKSPCLNCKDRQVEPINCHTICPKYLEFRKLVEEINREDREKRSINYHSLSHRAKYD